MEKRGKTILGIIFIIFLCAVFIVFFSWSEYNAKLFHWWHVGVLVGFTIIMVINRLIPDKIKACISWIKKYLKMAKVVTLVEIIREWLKDNFGFGKESSIEDGGLRREYFMATMPVYFVISMYLMKAYIKSGDIVTEALSILVLIFTLYLVFAALYRKLPEKLAKRTHLTLASVGYLTIPIFFIDLFRTVSELIGPGISVFYISAITIIGFTVGTLMILFQFIIVGVYSGRW